MLSVQSEYNLFDFLQWLIGRFLFKKWLNIETRIGDAAGQERAKTKAREWVAANAKPAEDDDDEAMEESSDEE
jgi:rRNA biogenesis protein RRP5